MPEAWGSLVLKLSESIHASFIERGPARDVIDAICSEAKVKPTPGSFGLDAKAVVKGDYLLLNPFGQEWMDLLSSLADKGKGKGTELYGYMRDEYGYEAAYVINAKGKRLCLNRFVECEDQEPAVSNVKIEKFVPKSVQKLLGEDAKHSIVRQIDDHLRKLQEKAEQPLTAIHEGRRYTLYKLRIGYQLERRSCDESSDEAILDAFIEASLPRAKIEAEEEHGVPRDSWESMPEK